MTHFLQRSRRESQGGLSRFSGLLLAGGVFVSLFSTAHGQAVERIWLNRIAPNSIASVMTDTANNPYVRIYRPASGANGAAAVVCPGGAYSSLSGNLEGTRIALWLNGAGITAFVLRYRLGTGAGGGYHHPVQMWDVQRSLRWVRANAGRFDLDTARVGIVGFSAGGHLAATAATHWDAGNPDSTSPHYYPGAHDSVDLYSSRPSFQMVIYPVITMDASFTHAGSRTALLGASATADLVNFLSNEKQVKAGTPPAFIAHTVDDAVVPVKNARVYRDSLTARGVRNQYREYASGPHGFGLADGQAGAPNSPTLATWTGYALNWLDSLDMRIPAPLRSARVSGHASRSAGMVRKQGVISVIRETGSASDLNGRRQPVVGVLPANKTDQ